MLDISLIFILGVALSSCFTFLMIRVGIHDEPDHRSSHVMPTPTSGGVGVLAALATIGLGFNMIEPEFTIFQSHNFLLAGALWVALIGLYDDTYEADAKVKFFLLAFISGLTAKIIGPVTYMPLHLPIGPSGLVLPEWFGLMGTALWIFVVMNAVNFLDGANGLMATHMLVAAAALCGISLWLGSPMAALWSGALAAGLLGFLFYNFRTKALIFCGDVGALLSGFMFSVAGLYLTKPAVVVEGPAALHGLPAANYLFIAPILILPLMADVLLTLLYRARKRKSLLTPHKDHLFQRAIMAGWSHTRVAKTYGLWAIGFAVLVTAGVFNGFIASILVLAGLSLFLSVTYTFMQRRFAYV